MSLRADELLKHLPVEIQYQELKALEESDRKNLISLARGRGLCFGLSLLMAIAILHINRIVGINFSANTDQPKSNSQIASALVDYAKKQNWEIRTGQGKYNIFYVQGMSPSGIRNDNAPNQFNDSRFLVEVNPTPRLIGAWEASIEPGTHYTKQPMNPQGTAQIQVPGHYKAWRIGKHKNRELALVQVAPVDIIRDTNRNGKVDVEDEKEHSQIGANQHSASDQKLVDEASAGCPVGRTSKGHQEFMSFLQQDLDYKNNKNFVFSTGFLAAKELRL
jgi:predicted ribonuclease toxin of YeeF-YezG toxin-antitoxin module